LAFGVRAVEFSNGRFGVGEGGVGDEGGAFGAAGAVVPHFDVEDAGDAGE
jgi:hypothetical protein